jgi:cytochrome P450
VDIRNLNLANEQMFINPYPTWKKLRNETPIFWYEPFQSWIFLDYEDVKYALKNDKDFSADRTRPLILPLLAKYGVKEDVFGYWIKVMSKVAMNIDGERHLRVRRVLMKLLTPEHVKNLTEYTNQLANDLINQISQNKEADLIRDFVAPLTIKTAARFVGIPEEMHEKCMQWLDGVQEFFAGADVSFEDALKAEKSIQETYEYFENVIKQRRIKLEADFISHFIQNQVSIPIDDDDIIAQAFFVIAAGYVSTRDSMGPVLNALISDLELRTKFLQNPSEAAINELLRYYPSDNYAHRIVTHDMTYKNFELKKGQPIFLGIASANRDPKVFEEPDKINLERANNDHLTFSSGPHFCPGYVIGKHECKIGWTKIFEKLPNIHLHPTKPVILNHFTFMFGGLHTLPVVF